MLERNFCLKRQLNFNYKFEWGRFTEILNIDHKPSVPIAD